LIYKARVAVPGAYGLPGNLNDEELRKVLKWLIQEMKLIHPDIDVNVSDPAVACPAPAPSRTSSQDRTCSEDRPWQHPILTQLIKTQWWGRKGEAKKLGNREDANPFINTPIAMMALVAAAVRLSLIFLEKRLIFLTG
jgi:Domain of unknown function (DUF6532)